MLGEGVAGPGQHHADTEQNEVTAKNLIEKTEKAGLNRLNEELKQSQLALLRGDSLHIQHAIIDAWEDWYIKAIASHYDMVLDSTSIQARVEKSQNTIKKDQVQNFENCFCPLNLPHKPRVSF